MAIRIKKKSKGRNRDRNSRGARNRGAGKKKLLTIRMPWADPNETCDCPICREFGIDPNDGDIQVTDIDSIEDEALLAGLMRQLGGSADMN